jgi:hypothetical protein
MYGAVCDALSARRVVNSRILFTYNVAPRLTQDCGKRGCQRGERILQPPARPLLLPEMARSLHRCGHLGSNPNTRVLVERRTRHIRKELFWETV